MALSLQLKRLLAVPLLSSNLLVSSQANTFGSFNFGDGAPVADIVPVDATPASLAASIPARRGEIRIPLVALNSHLFRGIKTNGGAFMTSLHFNSKGKSFLVVSGPSLPRPLFFQMANGPFGSWSDSAGTRYEARIEGNAFCSKNLCSPIVIASGAGEIYRRSIGELVEAVFNYNGVPATVDRRMYKIFYANDLYGDGGSAVLNPQVGGVAISYRASNVQGDMRQVVVTLGELLQKPAGFQVDFRVNEFQETPPNLWIRYDQESHQIRLSPGRGR